MTPTTRLSLAESAVHKLRYSVYSGWHGKTEQTKRVAGDGFFFVCAGVLWIHLGDFGVPEFRGGWLTGKILTMADVGALLFLSALVFTFFLPRLGAFLALAAILLCLPFYLYIVMPGPYRQIFKGEYSVPLQRAFVWNSWAIVEIITLAFAAVFSVRRLSGAIKS